MEYYKKIQQNWDKEEEQERIKIQLEKKRKIESRKFLSIIKQTKRKAHVYNDPYSIRDEKINKDLIQINNLLGKEKVNKVQLNRKIEEFIEAQDKEEERKLFNQSIVREKEKHERNRIIDKINEENEYVLKEQKINDRFFGEKTVITTSFQTKNSEDRFGEQYDKFKSFKEYVIQKNSK